MRLRDAVVTFSRVWQRRYEDAVELDLTTPWLAKTYSLQ